MLYCPLSVLCCAVNCCTVLCCVWGAVVSLVRRCDICCPALFPDRMKLMGWLCVWALPVLLGTFASVCWLAEGSRSMDTANTAESTSQGPQARVNIPHASLSVYPCLFLSLSLSPSFSVCLFLTSLSPSTTLCLPVPLNQSLCLCLLLFSLPVFRSPFIFASVGLSSSSFLFPPGSPESIVCFA